jgi:hypothetical protein
MIPMLMIQVLVIMETDGNPEDVDADADAVNRVWLGENTRYWLSW